MTENSETNVSSEVESTKDTIEFWLNHYRKNKWENQPVYPEIWIEKKALIGVFESVCKINSVLLSPCKGYPSLTFLKEAAGRFKENKENGKENIILYFGDYDASGEDIPRSIKDNLLNDFGIDVEVKRVLLMEEHVIEMQLPPAPTKAGDTRGNNWDGMGQVELDAVEPKIIQKYCKEAIANIFDDDLFEELKETEETESKEYKTRLKQFILDYEF